MGWKELPRIRVSYRADTPAAALVARAWIVNTGASVDDLTNRLLHFAETKMQKKPEKFVPSVPFCG
jgi:hypothetical protein